MNRLISFLAILAFISSSALAGPIALPCSKVTKELSPCLDFIISTAENPSLACCTGIKNISSRVKSREDRTDVCKCLKKTLGGIGPYDKNRIPLLPKKCGVPISLPPVDSNLDCSNALAYYGV
ncbi:hypothetical protein ACOSP7_000836 [Xanthoceras sorbifolium]